MATSLSKMGRFGSELALVLGFAAIIAAASGGKLQVGFYSKRCPAAESIVRNAVKAAVASDHRNAAILLRVHFHDCFVEVLLSLFFYSEPLSKTLSIAISSTFFDSNKS